MLPYICSLNPFKSLFNVPSTPNLEEERVIFYCYVLLNVEFPNVSSLAQIEGHPLYTNSVKKYLSMHSSDLESVRIALKSHYSDVKDTEKRVNVAYHFKNVEDDRKFLIYHLPFNASLWLSSFDFYRKTPQQYGHRLKELRKVIIGQTMLHCRQHFYFNKQQKFVPLDVNKLLSASLNTLYYTNDYNYSVFNTLSTDDGQRNDKRQPLIFIVEGDCLETALHLQSYLKSDVVVLNMASATHPGGGFLKGSGAQEENLHRRSNLFQCLLDPDGISSEKRKWKYPIPEFGGIYTPEAVVFRDSEVHGYEYLDEPKYLSFISVAAYRGPPLRQQKKPDGSTELLLVESYAERTKKKIRTIFNIAAQNGHKVLVLSALGAGAFQNPPAEIARLFKEVLEKEFIGVFEIVMFAIIDDHNTRKRHNPDGNVSPFSKVFGKNIIDFPKEKGAIEQAILKKFDKSKIFYEG